MLHIAAVVLATNADQAVAETNSKSLQRHVREIRQTDLMRLASTLAISTLPFVLDILGLPFALLLLLVVFKGYYHAHNYDIRDANDFLNNGPGLELGPGQGLCNIATPNVLPGTTLP